MRRSASPDTMIRIAIVDDHAMVRAGLRQFFADQIDFAVVAEAANGREALDIVRKGEVDVIVLDISMPDQSGVDALAAIKARAPDLPVLILSGFPGGALRHHAAAPGCERLPEQGLRPRRDRQGDPHGAPRAQVHHRRRGRAPGRRIGRWRRQAASRAAVGARVAGVPAAGQGRNHRPHGRQHVAQRQDGQHLPHPGDGKDETRSPTAT